jgi:hypothetical protein
MNKFYERLEDMSPTGKLQLFLCDEGDIHVTVFPCDPDGYETESASVEFCSIGTGGGQSPHTMAALKLLAVAIEQDNEDSRYDGRKIKEPTAAMELTADCTLPLQLTHRELSDIIREEDDRFKVLYDDIPKDGHSSQYIEDDGRQLRLFEFKDTVTGNEYDFGYVYHPEYDLDIPSSLMGPINGVEFVETSVIHPPVEPEPEPEPILSAEELLQQEMWAQYNENEKDYTDYENGNIPTEVIGDLVDFVVNSKYSLYQLRAKIIPVCIKYQVEQKSLWAHIQKTRGAWK